MSTEGASIRKALITGITGQDGSYLAELLLEKGCEVHGLILGTGREISIRELIELIVETSGFKGDVRWDPSKPDGQPRRALDTSRARELFQFEARTPFEDGLRRTVERRTVEVGSTADIP